MRCGRCTTTRCEAHALPPNTRCDRCERDWADDAPTRRSAKLIFVPALSILVGGILFGLLLPLGGALGAIVMWALACGAAGGVAAGACRLVDRNARALFLRERAGGLPPARLLPSPKR
jgi:membrane associated rhomboid family serine protease